MGWHGTQYPNFKSNDDFLIAIAGGIHISNDRENKDLACLFENWDERL